MELRLGDPSDSTISRKAAANVPEQAPGRGITGESLHFLTAEPRLATADAADLARAVARAWSGPAAPPVRLLPTSLPYSVIASNREDNRLALPIGIAEADLQPVRIDFAAEPHFLLFGDAECGKSTFLRALATTITTRFTPEQARIILVDYRRSLLGAVETEHLIGYGTAAAQTAGSDRVGGRLHGAPHARPGRHRRAVARPSWWTGPECFVLVDDYDLVASGPSNPLLPLLEYLPQARDVGLHLVAHPALRWREPRHVRADHSAPAGTVLAGLVMSGDREEGRCSATSALDDATGPRLAGYQARGHPSGPVGGSPHPTDHHGRHRPRDL